MQEKTRIPRWLVESDPSWERSIDSNVGMLKWTKKGTGVQAVCPPTSMFCEIVGDNGGSSNHNNDNVQAGLADLNASVARMGRQQTRIADDISKYLSSRYVNPGINGPRPDLTKRLRRTF
ncbi:MAG: hypothetical protein C4292_05915 [Nitrososphaera sp.]